MPQYDPRASAPPSRIDPARGHKLVAASADETAVRYYALYAETAGSVTLVDDHGQALSYTLAQGQTLDFSPARITAVTGTIYGWY